MPTNAPTILVATHEPALRDLIVLALRRLRPESAVVTADDGPAALALALGRKSRPQLMLIDLLLPQLNGLEVMRRLRAQKPPVRLPVIAISGLAFRETVQAAQAAGAQEFLVKPIDAELLTAKVNKALPKAPAQAVH